MLEWLESEYRARQEPREFVQQASALLRRFVKASIGDAHSSTLSTELARIGGTSIEWVLTGSHWENGSDEQERVSPDLLSTACILREVSADGRATVNEALRIVRDAVRALEEERVRHAEGAASFRDHSSETLHLLEAASRIQQAVLRRVTQEADRRLGRTAIFASRSEPDDRGDREEPPAADGS